MFPTITLLATLLLALSVAANPVVINRSPVTLPISRRVNFTSIHNLVRHDQARAKALKAKGAVKAAGVFLNLHTDAVISSPADNQAVAYTATVGIGIPATNYTLIIDSGSGNTWIDGHYVKTGTSRPTPFTVTLPGGLTGTEFIDTVTIAPGLVIPNQSIGVASSTGGGGGFDGGLGIGPVDLTQGTLSGGGLIPTVTDNLFSQGTITADEVAISFEPTTSPEVLNGELTWGGTDSTKFTGSITSIPVTSTSPSNLFWGINQSIRYGTSTNILSTTAGIIDTGTTLLLLATDGFNKYKTATGAVLDSTTGLLRITSAQFSALQSLFFIAGGTTFELTANAQLWPRSLNVDIGGTAGNIYLIVNDLGTPSGQGLDFINGYAFLERFYVVLDTTHKAVGLANTPFTHATTN